MVASSPIARLTLKGNTADQSSLTFAEGTKTLTMVSPQYEFKTTGFGGNIIAIDASSQLYVNVPAGSYANVLGYDVATGAVRYQPASGGGADVSGGSNISVVQNSGKQIVSLAVREDIDMSANSIINCKSIELPRYPNTSSAKITFGNMSDGKYGKITYEDYDRKLLISSDTNIELRCNGAFAVRDTGIFMETPTTISAVVKSSTDNSNVSSVAVNNQNTLVIGATDISGMSPTVAFQTDVSRGSISFARTGMMRLTADSYAFNTVPSASPVLPTVLGYNTATGEIKAQPATNGISALSAYTYNASGSLTVSGSTSFPVFTPSATGIYGINFIIKI